MSDQTVAQEKLEQIEKQLVEIIINAYNSEAITYIELKQSGKYILNHVDTIKTHSQLMDFLNNLASYWTIFAPLATMESAGDQKAADQDKILEIQNIIKSLS